MLLLLLLMSFILLLLWADRWGGCLLFFGGGGAAGEGRERGLVGTGGHVSGKYTMYIPCQEVLGFREVHDVHAMEVLGF